MIGITPNVSFAENSLYSSLGLSYEPLPGYVLLGYDFQGRPIFVDPRQSSNDDAKSGSRYIQQFKKLLLPFEVLGKDDISSLDKVASVADDALFLANLGRFVVNKDPKGFVSAILSRYGQNIVTDVTDDPREQVGLAASINAFNLYLNWDRLNAGQRAVGVANVGIQSIESLSGLNLFNKVIPGTEGKGGSGGLTVGHALQLLSYGFNAYGIAKSWKQLDTVQKVLYGAGTIAEGAVLADKLGLLGRNVSNGLVAGASKDALAGMGAIPAPALGVGAIVIKQGGVVPAGYVGVQSLADGSQVAIPVQNANTAAISPVSTASQIASLAGFALSAYNLAVNYDNLDSLGRVASAAQTVSLGASAAQGSGLGLPNVNLGTVASGAGALAGAYGMYRTLDMVGDAPAGGRRNVSGAVGGAASGAAMGAVLGPIGAAVGGAVGGAIGLLSSVFGSSKDKYQKLRDAGRKYLQKQGILDEKFQGTLADGSKYDFGKDGKKLPKLDYKDPMTGRIISKANLLAASEGFSGRALEAMAMLYTAAALSNANGNEEIAVKNIKHMLAQRNFNSKDVAEHLGRMYKEGKISREQYEVFSKENEELLGASGVSLIPPSEGEKKFSKAQSNLQEKKVLNYLQGSGAKVYAGWGKPPKPASAGVDGGSAFMAGLQAMGRSNPYLLGSLIAYSANEFIGEDDKGVGVPMDILSKLGVVDDDGVVTLPNGVNVRLRDEGNIRVSSQPEKAEKLSVNYNKRGYLKDYDVDNVNDLDYFSGLAGIAFSRTIGGTSSSSVDRLGGLLGNLALAGVGSGKEFTPENLSRVMSNHRSLFAKAGINSKGEAYALANQGYAEGRFNELQLGHLLNTYDIIFDNDFGKANVLAVGRHKGLEVLVKEKFDNRGAGSLIGYLSRPVKGEGFMTRPLGIPPMVTKPTGQVGGITRPLGIPPMVTKPTGQGGDIPSGITRPGTLIPQMPQTPSGVTRPGTLIPQMPQTPSGITRPGTLIPQMPQTLPGIEGVLQDKTRVIQKNRMRYQQRGVGR